MDRRETWTELLERIKPLLGVIFAEHGVTPDEAQEIVEQSFLVLMSKRLPRNDPERWLLRTIEEKCRKLSLLSRGIGSPEDVDDQPP